MPPTALDECPETEEFIDWVPSARLEPSSMFEKPERLGEEESLVFERMSLWDTSHKASIALVQSSPDRSRDDIHSVVRSAFSLTELRDNWDGEGSLGYSLSTWRRVRRFLLWHASLSKSLFRAALPLPTINPADQGSLDLFWRLSDRQLLINFPADETAPITYYGQNREGNNTISGRTTGRERRLDLVAWLIQRTK